MAKSLCSKCPFKLHDRLSSGNRYRKDAGSRIGRLVLVWSLDPILPSSTLAPWQLLVLSELGCSVADLLGGDPFQVSLSLAVGQRLAAQAA